MNDWQIMQLARIRQQEIDRELNVIRLTRLSRNYPTNDRRKRSATLFTIGRVFVSWGAFLQKRYGAVTVKSGSCH